jgi:hypothetical protein
MQSHDGCNKNPKTFADLLETVQSGADVESRYYEFKDADELAQSLNAHNIQTLASIIEARPAAFSAPLGLALCDATIGDDVAPFIMSLRTAMSLRRVQLSNLRMGDACMAAFAHAISAERSDPCHHGLKNVEELILSENCIGDRGVEDFFAAANMSTDAHLNSNGLLVRKAYPLPKLTRLDLRKNSFGARGAAAMAAALRAGALPSLRAPQFGGGMNGLYVDKPILLDILSSFDKRPGGIGLWADDEEVKRQLASEKRAIRLNSAVVVEVLSNEHGLFGWRVDCWNNQLYVSELADDGPAKASGLLLFDEVLAVGDAPLSGCSSDAMLLNQKRDAHTAFRFAICRQTPVLKMSLGKPTLAGALEVVELMKTGNVLNLRGIGAGPSCLLWTTGGASRQRMSMLKADQGLARVAAIHPCSRWLFGCHVLLMPGMLPKSQDGSSRARLGRPSIFCYMRFHEILNSGAVLR